MVNIIQPEIPIQQYISSRRSAFLGQEDYIRIEILQQKIETSKLEDEINDYFTILEYINKINSGWFKTVLKIKDDDMKNWLLSDLESYQFFKNFTEYLALASENEGIVIENFELEPANYEYSDENLDEFVLALKVPDSLSSDEFVELWDRLSKESYNFIDENDNYSNLFNDTIIVLRR